MRARSPFPVPVSPQIRIGGKRCPTDCRRSCCTFSRTATIPGLAPSNCGGAMAVSYVRLFAVATGEFWLSLLPESPTLARLPRLVRIASTFHTERALLAGAKQREPVGLAGPRLRRLVGARDRNDPEALPRPRRARATPASRPPPRKRCARRAQRAAHSAPRTPCP